jgi:hypothetical protein
MERRDFLSGAAGAAAAAAGGVAPAAAHASIPPGLDLGNFVARLDRTLDALTRATLCDLTPPEGEADKWGRYDVLCRKALRSLHLAGTFHDVPHEVRGDSRFQDRMWSALPEMDDAVFGMAEALDEIGEDGIRDLRHAFLNDADVRAQTMERLFAGLQASEITDDRLERSQSLLRQIRRELGRENPSGMVGEVIRQVSAVGHDRSGGPDAWERRLAEASEESPQNAGPLPDDPTTWIQVGSRVRLLLRDSETEVIGVVEAVKRSSFLLRLESGYVMPIVRENVRQLDVLEPSPKNPCTDAERARDEAKKLLDLCNVTERGFCEAEKRALEKCVAPGARTLRAGAWLMGIGAGTTLASFGVLSSNCGVACVGIGIGAFLLVVGLGFLIVGAVLRGVTKLRQMER